MIENFLSENNCIISNKIIKPTPVLPNYIVFADPIVKQICVENWGFNGEITYEQAAAVTDLGNAFQPGQYPITSFDELQYFTGLTEIAASAFSGNVELTSVILPPSVTIIGDMAFADCSQLTNVYIPDTVTIINEACFKACDGLTSIMIPTSVETVGNNVFQACTGLTTLISPNSTPPTIGYGILQGCDSLIHIYVPCPNVADYQNAENWNEYSSLISCLHEPSEVITFADPEVERICIENWSSDGIGLTYEDAAAVTTLNQVFTLNESITSFDELQFFTSLQTITDKAFSACVNLLSINIPPSVTSIGKEAFISCQNLLSINIPNSVNSIDEGAFHDCIKLKSVILPNGITKLSKTVFYACQELDSIIIPNSVTSIDDEAFYACYLLPIIIPNSVKTIGIASFGNCGTPVSIIIPNSVTEIGERAFQYCFSLQSLYMQSINPPIIGNQCFPIDIALSTIYVPAESVDDYKTAENWSDYADIITALN